MRRGWAGARELALTTPANRDRYVDFLRALSITAVVVGHWLAVTIVMVDGRVEGRHVLEVLPEVHPLTWVFQVIGVFFLVGGYANAASWSAAERADVGYGEWLTTRATRLLAPTSVFIAVGATAGVVTRAAGVDPELVRLGAWLIAISLWFLAIYLVVVALTPIMLVAHRRWGLGTVLVLAAAVAVGDVVRLSTGEAAASVANFVLVWLIAHQFGFAWSDGTLTRARWQAWALFAIGLTGLLAATTVGPYPVSMVAYPGAPLQNTSPPTLALLALIVTQTGLALVLAPPMRRLLARVSVWTAVIAVNGVIMTLFLWHMVPVVIAALALYPTGIMPDPDVGSAAWFALRPVWLIACAVSLVVLVAAFGWAERMPVTAKPSVPQRRWRTALAVCGVVGACGGIGLLTVTGLQGDGPLGIPVSALVTYAAGIALLVVSATECGRRRGDGLGVSGIAESSTHTGR